MFGDRLKELMLFWFRQFTETEIIKYYKINADKIFVT